MEQSKQLVLNRAIDLLRTQFPGLRGVYLFGTFGTQYERADSDLDLAILLSGPLENLKRWDIAQELSRELHKDVDLIDLQTASTVLKYVVFTEGKRILSLDEEFCDAFELQSISRYLHFNEARKDFLPRSREG